MFKFPESDWRKYLSVPVVFLVAGSGVYLASVSNLGSTTYTKEIIEDLVTGKDEAKESESLAWPVKLDTKEYDQRLLELANYVPPKPFIATTTLPDGTVSTSTESVSNLIYSSSTNVTVEGQLWPPATPYPLGDAILPFQRILAYYGNFYSTRMGILGEFEPEVVIEKLMETKALWEAADPDTPVLPAIEYIAMVAQADAGADGMYRAVMPEEEIEKAYQMTKEIEGIMILDIQIGKSPIENELPQFRKYLERPDVHLAIDPEFSMKYGEAPGRVIGTFNADDINYVINFMSEIVREKQLPPKVLVIHRFTQDMVTGSSNINPTPEVQVVMNMDGWGSKDLKRGTYRRVIEPEPVQFTGVKIFYKNDLKPPSTGIFTPDEVLDLDPKPIYIQYQ